MVEYKYDAWGATLAKTGSMAGTLGVHNPFRYRGYVFDLDTGLYYLKSRYYNPKWGRFINADVVLGKRGALLSHNLFAYCVNNPIRLSDKKGYSPTVSEWECYVESYIISGTRLYEYTQILSEKYTPECPEPRIVNAIKRVLNLSDTNVFAELDTFDSVVNEWMDYKGLTIEECWRQYKEHLEYFYYSMLEYLNNPTGYKLVKVDILYGSHSAELRLTMLDLVGNVKNCDAIITTTEAFPVLENMSEMFGLICVDGLYSCTPVPRGFTME